jgi:nucleotide-binding universal stress UspA family protein
MYRKVIVPLDGSPLAEVALPYAEEMAGKIGSEVILFSVLQSEEAQEYQKHHRYAVKIEEATKRHVAKYLDKSENRIIKVGMVTRTGNPAEGILNYISKGYLSLIVMATHGRSGLSRWAVGSVADKVVRSTTKQALMLIRAKGAHPDMRARRILKKALVPLDGSIGSEAVIPHIMGVAPKLKMELTLLQVIPKTNHTYASAEAYLQSLCSQLEDKSITAKYEIKVGNPADQIIDLADELAMDLVVMSTHGQTAINLWPLGSIAQKVLLGGNTPLLLMRA